MAFLECTVPPLSCQTHSQRPARRSPVSCLGSRTHTLRLYTTQRPFQHRRPLSLRLQVLRLHLTHGRQTSIPARSIASAHTSSASLALSLHNCSIFSYHRTRASHRLATLLCQLSLAIVSKSCDSVSQHTGIRPLSLSLVPPTLTSRGSDIFKVPKENLAAHRAPAVLLLTQLRYTAFAHGLSHSRSLTHSTHVTSIIPNL